MAVDARSLALEGFWPGLVGGLALATGGMLAGDSGAPASPAPAAPGATNPFGGALGDAWTDRERSYDDFLRDVERIRRETEGDYEIWPAPEPLVRVRATSLQIEVRATFLPVEVHERGNIITFTARFTGYPDEVCFIYTRPGESRPRVDPGFGRPGSGIYVVEEHPDGSVELGFDLDTTGFPGGILHTHFFSTGAHQASGFEDIEIPARKAQLL